MKNTFNSLIIIAAFAMIPAVAFGQTPLASASSVSASAATGGSASSAAPSTGDSSSSGSPSTGDSSSSGTPSTGGSTSSGTPSTGGSTSSGTPSTGDSSSSATPSTGDSSSSATPSTGGSSSSATPSTGDSTSSATPYNGGSETPTTPTTPANGSNGGSSNAPGGVTSMSGGHRRFGIFAQSNCSLVTKAMRRGVANDSAEVTKLQSFLRDYEKMDVDVSGIFDEKTEKAVIAFQEKYAQTVLAPWGARFGNGNVSITTMKKINQIACNQPLTLDPIELAKINAYRGNVTGATQPAPTVVTVFAPGNDGSDTGSTDAVITVEDANDDNTAAVGNTSVASKFWNFLLRLFR